MWNIKTSWKSKMTIPTPWLRQAKWVSTLLITLILGSQMANNKFSKEDSTTENNRTRVNQIIQNILRESNITERSLANISEKILIRNLTGMMKEGNSILRSIIIRIMPILISKLSKVSLKNKDKIIRMEWATHSTTEENNLPILTSTQDQEMPNKSKATKAQVVLLRNTKTSISIRIK